MVDDDRRRFPTARPRDPRRQTHRDLDEPHAEARGIVVSERELAMFKRRIESDLDQRIADLAAGLEERVKHAVKAELAPYLGQLSKVDDIIEHLEQDRIDRERYRAKQEERAAIEAERRAREQHDAAMAKAAAETGALHVNTRMAPIESTRKYRAALFATLAAIVAALAGLVGAAIGSHGGK